MHVVVRCRARGGVAAAPPAGAEAEVQRLQNEASGTATKIDPTAAAVAGGLCGLLLCNSVGLAQLDLLGAGAGAAAMFAALDSMGSAEAKEKVEAK